MESEPKGADREGSGTAQWLSPWNRVLLFLMMLWMLGIGVNVIVTREASAGLGFHGGPATLGPVAAWWTGLAYILVGLVLAVLAFVSIRRHGNPSGELTTGATENLKQAPGATEGGLLRLIHLIDALFLVCVLTAVLACAVFSAESLPGRWSLLVFAMLATAFPLYKLVRVVLELRAGVSVHSGTARRSGPDYERAARPVAFWWAMGVELAYLLLGAAVAVLLWAAFATPQRTGHGRHQRQPNRPTSQYRSPRPDFPGGAASACRASRGAPPRRPLAG